ncbi:hypothetical protein CORC01_12009 [Colletotrichum orchidophilum]|uniref:Chromo domain-containing protein n=1 Tax=Colletotrichum orchidophilum TaxID=1209926 RepID=A0A1G4AU89_9PEZI|nr:uncharacterized protein CORC01_12009 [Colletotrichum orchidophilum]OHE92675.1 hypothetical protein CORC01_12009 [Colletotrichum orchidophilum]
MEAYDYSIYLEAGGDGQIKPLDANNFTLAIIQELKTSRILDHFRSPDDLRVILLSQPRDKNEVGGFSTKDETIRAVHEEHWQEIDEPKVLQYWASGLRLDGKNREAQLDGIAEFYIFRVLDHDAKKRELLVQWVGYGKDEATWMPLWRALESARAIVKDYLEEHNLTQDLRTKKSYKGPKTQLKRAGNGPRSPQKSLDTAQKPSTKRSRPSARTSQARQDIEQRVALAKSVEDAALASMAAMRMATAMDQKLQRTRDEIFRTLREEAAEQETRNEHRFERLEQDVARLHNMMSQQVPLKRLKR